jgi:hypothetical protein
MTRSAGCLPPDELADLLDGRLADPPNLQSGDDLYIAVIDIEPNIVPRLTSGLQRQFLRRDPRPVDRAGGIVPVGVAAGVLLPGQLTAQGRPVCRTRVGVSFTGSATGLPEALPSLAANLCLTGASTRPAFKRADSARHKYRRGAHQGVPALVGCGSDARCRPDRCRRAFGGGISLL